jgi:hypothetical protein
MKTKLYTFVFYCACFLVPLLPAAQPFYNCNNLQFTFSTTESRCTATGTISVTVTGGSGSYNYKVQGPVNMPFTSSSTITGLPPGTYTIVVQDAVSSCTKSVGNAVVSGSYQDPAFTLQKTDLTCVNGNDGTITATGVQFGRAPFTFSIIAPSASGVGTSNGTGVFTNLSPGDYFIQLRDSCGGIQTRQVTIYNFNWFASAYTVTKVGCDSADVVITLTDNLGNNNIPPSTAFNGFTYGCVKSAGDTVWMNERSFRIYLGTNRSVQLVVKDRCGLVQQYTWNDMGIRPSVAASVTISNRSCNDFSATVTGQQNLTNPEYCLYTAANTLITCNTTGAFSNIPYGSYCIQIRDQCYDTTITRCFNVIENAPVIGSISGGSYSCSTFTASITAQTNLTNPQFCIYNSSNVLLGCNGTGVFPGLPYGSYCITMTNDPVCYDTTIIRCINIPFALPSAAANVNISNRACSTFTASVTGQTNLTNPQYCLYDNNNVLITCNSTGVFDSLLYGSYCIRIINDPACYDTTINRCFTVTPNKPSVAANISISNQTCTGFQASVTGQSNLNNPNYCLYDSAGVLILCSKTPVFTDLPYGSYCIQIENNPGCYDTTIVRCFTRQRSVMNFNVQTNIACDTGISQLNITFTGGTSPYRIEILNPDSTVAYTAGPQSSSSFSVQLPDLPAGLSYTVIGTDGCGNTDSLTIDPVSRSLTTNTVVAQKCPGGMWPGGYGDITANHLISAGNITARIIEKDGAGVSIHPTVFSATHSLFASMGPGTYVIRYNYTAAGGCSRFVYDTIVVKNYEFPNLSQSAAYQCNNNSFSVNAAVQNGIGPFVYEIIGSVPAIPSLAGITQTNPLFAINNGTAYSLIRLRVLDACANATLNDVSILPLANSFITASGNCYYNNVNLTVNTVAGAQYTWYKRTSATDSVQIGTGPVYNIPYLLPPDTGMYICFTSVNNGCLTRIAYFHVNAACGDPLTSSHVVLKGRLENNTALLQWNKPAELILQEVIVERSVNGGRFEKLGAVLINQGFTQYMFTDADVATGKLRYRLLLQYANGTASYSNMVLLEKKLQRKINVFPNPLRERSTLQLNNVSAAAFQLEVFSVNGQRIVQQQLFVPAEGTVILERRLFPFKGVYTVKATNLITKETEVVLLQVN